MKRPHEGRGALDQGRWALLRLVAVSIVLSPLPLAVLAYSSTHIAGEAVRREPRR